MLVSFGLLHVRVVVAAAAMMMAASPAAHATYEITVAQVGSDVVFTGTGSIDLTGSVNSGTVPPVNFGEIYGGNATLAVGLSDGSASNALYHFNTNSITTPNANSFESKNFRASLDTGPIFEILGVSDALLYLPDTYVSGASLGISTSTYDNATIAGLDLNPGVYTWTLPDDSITLTVPASVPEPPDIALMALPGAALFLLPLRRKPAKNACAAGRAYLSS
jgi:hypothetical protein